MKNNTQKTLKNTTKSSRFSQKFRELFSSKIIIALTLLTLGVCCSSLANSAKAGKDKASQNDEFVFDPFFGDDIFKEMAAMQKRMDKIFKEHQKQMEQAFAAAEKSNNKVNIVTKNDEKFYYYELNFKGYDKNEIEVAIKDDVLSFIGQKNDKKAQKSFNYSFLLPNYDKSAQPEIVRGENKIEVKIKK